MGQSRRFYYKIIRIKTGIQISGLSAKEKFDEQKHEKTRSKRISNSKRDLRIYVSSNECFSGLELLIEFCT